MILYFKKHHILSAVSSSLDPILSGLYQLPMAYILIFFITLSQDYEHAGLCSPAMCFSRTGFQLLRCSVRRMDRWRQWDHALVHAFWFPKCCWWRTRKNVRRRVDHVEARDNRRALWHQSTNRLLLRRCVTKARHQQSGGPCLRNRSSPHPSIVHISWLSSRCTNRNVEERIAKTAQVQRNPSGQNRLGSIEVEEIPNRLPVMVKRLWTVYDGAEDGQGREDLLLIVGGWMLGQLWGTWLKSF